MTTDHEMRMHALELFEQNERMTDILLAIDHTLCAHGHVDRATPLHQRIINALNIPRAGAEPLSAQTPLTSGADLDGEAIGRTGGSIPPTGAKIEASPAFGYALRLLEHFVAEHFPHNPDWKPCGDLMGVLTQLDNAITIARDYKAALGEIRKYSEDRTSVRAASEALDASTSVSSKQCGGE